MVFCIGTGICKWPLRYPEKIPELIKKYFEFKNCMLHVKLIVYCTVSFTCNIHFLNSTCFIFNQFKRPHFGVSFAVEYIIYRYW